MIYKVFITSAIEVGSIWAAVTAADIKTILVQSLVYKSTEILKTGVTLLPPLVILSAAYERN